ncbi:hypothetical protein ACSZMD_08720 [Aeromonas veronii]
MRPLIVFLFTLLPFFATGMPSIAQFIKQAEVIKVTAVNSVTSTAINVTTMIRGFAANDPYAIKTLEVPKATYMTRLKAGMGETGGLKGLVKRNAWYAAWFATMAAAGWAIDELTNQMVKPSKVTRYIGKSGNFNSPTYLGGNFSLEDAVAAVVKQCFDSGYINCASNGVLDYKPAPERSKFTITYSHPSTPNKQSSRLIDYYPTQINEDVVGVEPVPDDALYDSLASYMIQDPKAASQAFMVPDAWPYPYPNVFPETVPYIPGVSESDQDALDLYYKGLLQSTNPNAPNYVTPERYQQIADLATKLQQGQTPEGQAGALNDDLKKPLTQKQLEETLKKQQEEQAKADADAAAKAQQALAPADTALDKLSEEKKWFEDTITGSANQSPPSQGLSLPKWVWPVGSCKPFPITFSISKLSAKANDGGAFCDNYNNVFHPLIYWFLYMLLALYIFVLWNKTMVQVLGSR